MGVMALISPESMEFRSPARHATGAGRDIGVRGCVANVQK
jgi:hypothetical protein